MRRRNAQRTKGAPPNDFTRASSVTQTSRQPASRRLRAVLAMTAILACQQEAPPPAATPPSAPAPPPAPPQPAPENTFSVVGVAAGDVLPLRVLPDATSHSLVWIPSGTTNVLDMGGYMPDAEDEQATWQRVGYAGLAGWVNARFLKSNQPPNSSPAPELATGTKLGAVVALSCFGKKASWSLKFGVDGRATCAGTCKGPAGLRAANVSVTYSGDVQGFDLIDARDAVFLHATTRATASCRDGASKNAHYYEFNGTSERGPLTGCCRNLHSPSDGSELGHARRRRR
jgi:hypothetical protein